MVKCRLLLAAASVCMLVIGAAPNAQAELVGHYTFEEGSVTVVKDVSGRNNHGELVNPRTDSWASGQSGGGLFLPGIPGYGATYVNLGNPVDFQLTNAFTFAAWVYSTAPATDAPILAKEDVTFGTSYWFGVFYDGFGTLCDVDGWWGWDLDRRGVPVSAWNQWNHLAATWDGATLSQYLNGVLVDSVAFSGPIANTASNLTIGINSGVWSTAFTGTVDDIRIYNHALTAAEISRLGGSAVSGCVNLLGSRLTGAKVMLKQEGTDKQTTRTDGYGCYSFKTVASGQPFKVEILGPVPVRRRPVRILLFFQINRHHKRLLLY